MLDPNEPRPRSYTRTMDLAAAAEMAEMLAKQNGLSMHADEIVDNLMKHVHSWSNGYLLARDLDQYCGWQPDAEMVMTLDHLGSMRSDQLEKAEKDWASRLQPQAVFAVGDEVAYDCRRDGEVKGLVHSIDAARARYVVDTKYNGNGGVLIPFEDVRAA